ncbi:MAG TPA: hypothetical protein PLG27_07400, partial [Candidatus Latescibacteria bacterium]|nr:hypothetical protein [Candidatus Latescibacterota bacterium]
MARTRFIQTVFGKPGQSRLWGLLLVFCSGCLFLGVANTASGARTRSYHTTTALPTEAGFASQGGGRQTAPQTLVGMIFPTVFSLAGSAGGVVVLAFVGAAFFSRRHGRKGSGSSGTPRIRTVSPGPSGSAPEPASARTVIAAVAKPFQSLAAGVVSLK